MKENKYYILFDNHEQAIKMHRDLQNVGIDSRIAPTPRAASLCCGVCLMIQGDEYTKLNGYLSTHPYTYREIKELKEEYIEKRDAYL